MDHAPAALSWMGDHLGPYLPRLIGALAIVAAAWLAARLVRLVVARLATKANLDQRLHHAGLSALLADTAQWLVWLLALPALLGTLGLQGLLEPVNAMLSRMMGFLPNLLGASVVLGVGLLLASIARRVVVGLLTAAGAERVSERLGMNAALGQHSLAGIAGSIVFALVLLPTLAAALQALGLEPVAKPMAQLLDTITAMVPRLLSAAVVLGAGALIGRALASVASGLLAGMGANRWPQHLGLPQDTRVGGRDASELGGLLVMVAVMFVALAQASQVLGFGLLTEAVSALGQALARLAVAALLLGVGLWLAQLAAQLVQASAVAHAGTLSRLARVAVIFFAVALALRQAGLPAEIVAIAFGSVVGALALGAALAIGLGGRHAAERLLDRAERAFHRPGDADGPPSA